MYEWRTGTVPKTVEKHQNVTYNFGDEEEESSNDKIDFDVVDFNIESETAIEISPDQVFIIFG